LCPLLEHRLTGRGGLQILSLWDFPGVPFGCVISESYRHVIPESITTFMILKIIIFAAVRFPVDTVIPFR
jgi:hypothetical protein